MEKKTNNKLASILEKVSRNSAKAVAGSRCTCFLHQPKQPADIKKICK